MCIFPLLLRANFLGTNSSRTPILISNLFRFIVKNKPGYKTTKNTPSSLATGKGRRHYTIN